jgi:hypothetical protein
LAERVRRAGFSKTPGFYNGCRRRDKRVKTAVTTAENGSADSRIPHAHRGFVMPAPIRVAITGAAGQIGYALIFRIASGEVFGPNQPVILHLVEVPPVMPALTGVEMELEECAFGS